MEKEMPAESLVELYRDLESRGIKVWLDGGWGVDALLGRQTRPHDDVDLVIQQKDLDVLVSFLRKQGYKEVPKDDTRPWNFVLGNDTGKEVDIHVITINEKGDGIYGPPESKEIYSADALQGLGTINGHPVLCMTAKYQIVNRPAKRSAKDVQDIKNLCEHFNLRPPIR